MTREELYESLKDRFQDLLERNGLAGEPVAIVCRSLSPEEAIGHTERRDYPILTGKDVMIQAEFRGGRGQAFTDAPADFSGTLSDILRLDPVHDPHERSLFIASLNAVANAVGLCTGTVHCRNGGPENCAADVRRFLTENYPSVRHITQVGYQPALLAMLSDSGFRVRVLDLNPANIGQIRSGIRVEDGVSDMEDAIRTAELILCTGSTLCNGTIVDYLLPDKEVLFYGISAAGASALMGWKRLCFADRYSE